MALSDQERAAVLDVLVSDRFMERAPKQIAAILSEEDNYLCSAATMYRILRANQMVKERRNQARHPEYTRPELIATGPKMVWSWDITKLRGPSKMHYYCLYMVLDIFSRYIVAWRVAEKESEEIAREMLFDAALEQEIKENELTIHADRGSSMRSKTVAELLVDLGITRSHSRPHVSNDNPFSESSFKTLKGYPTFPDRFGSVEDARLFCKRFVAYYNQEHRHSGISMLTPESVHYGRAEAQLKVRQYGMMQGYARHPERFVKGAPKEECLQAEVWINPPKPFVISSDSQAQHTDSAA